MRRAGMFPPVHYARKGMGEKTQDDSTVTTQPQVFRREGEYWTLEFGGVVCRMRDTAGLSDLACLLRQPHRAVGALEIVQARGKDLATGETTADVAAIRERARVNVTRAIAAALKRIDTHSPLLAEHLRATIRTGHQCTYKPDPRLPVSWEM